MKRWQWLEIRHWLLNYRAKSSKFDDDVEIDMDKFRKKMDELITLGGM